ncbi:hypothetical protein L1049_002459 [Liquidambar formosana]|uniref:UDP-N-acetylglucosamine--dolichyl-phosphate N-acetylglucosaminephosphotransferase n=1 Tax=Liquidambar formosana TaxID=63359 RepID=A0AAP0NHV3_LIQFO
MAARKRASSDTTTKPPSNSDTAQRKPRRNLFLFSITRLSDRTVESSPNPQILSPLLRPLLLPRLLPLQDRERPQEVHSHQRHSQLRGLLRHAPSHTCGFHLRFEAPESLGIVIGIVFLVVAILFQFSNFTSDSNWLVEYNAALASICFMTLLGFVDDVLDVPWRVKLVLPSFAALPLLMAYAGHTTIIIPKPLIPYVGLEVLDLGWIYKLYMGLLAVFCTNSINIHAGLNGLEVGQTVVIASAILIHNVMQIGGSTDPEYKQAHAFSIYLVQPLLATSLALLSYNWYPSSVFVGDTYTYFAGMTMAVVGILGHFRFDPQTGLLTGTDDGTLVNLFLRKFGRMSEKSLCILLLVFQAIGCCFCFVLRWFLAGWYK